jgi:predicted AAA+ superfamily ATPase
MLRRRADLSEITRLFRLFPIVGILGPRQVGKTTLANAWGRARRGPVHRFDLEDALDLGRLDDITTPLRDLEGVIVIDEIQRRPELFPFLRVLADKRPRRARYLVLGSAAPTLLKQSAESLTGRIGYYELTGLGLSDVGAASWRKLWLRGGFPRPYLERTESGSQIIREQIIRTYIERDLPQFDTRATAALLRRFWTMLAHYHGQVWNSAAFAGSLGVSDKTVRGYLDLLADTFMVRVLPPWSENVGKRVVKSPKVYIADSGMLHALLDLPSRAALESHPKLGASFEGFAMQEVIRRLRVQRDRCHFWATHQGAELDLLVKYANKRYGYEFKHTDAPSVTKSMRIALEDLKLERIDVIHVGKETYPLTDKVRAVSIERLQRDIEPLL